MSEDLGTGRPSIGINELAGNDSMTVKGLTIR